MAEKEIRAVLGENLAKLMAEDPRIVVVDADLAKASGTFGLRDKFPERALDVGIAEQNMVSFAAGLAACGMIPFVSSFTAFASRRPCDQIAISAAYAKRPVKIIGTDPGLSAELNGGTHMSVEDIGVLRSIPDLLIYEVVDAVQLEQALPQIVAYDGPVYIRMFRKAISNVFDPASYKFDLLKADIIQPGSDVSIFATGIMVQEGLEALKLLKDKGVSAEFINMHTIKPLDKAAVLASVAKTKAVVTCENHNVIGGLGSAIAELLAVELPTPMKLIGIQDRFGQVGEMPFLKEEYGMTAKHIADAALAVIARKA